MKNLIIFVTLLCLAVVAFTAFNSYIYQEKQAPAEQPPEEVVGDYRTLTYVFDGTPLPLGTNGTAYFGNELTTDLNSDGRADVVFIATHQPGGSGTFFYVLGAVKTETGYEPIPGYLLGDRIAPQTTELSQNPNHENVIVVNFAERAANEPMTTPPSVGISAYIKYDGASGQWGVVEPDFTGEANPSSMSLTMQPWTWQQALFNDGRELVPNQPGKFTLTFNADGSFGATTDCNNAGGSYTTDGNQITFSDIFSTMMFCENSQETDFVALLQNTSSYFFTERGELILELQYDSGTATFR